MKKKLVALLVLASALACGDAEAQRGRGRPRRDPNISAPSAAAPITVRIGALLEGQSNMLVTSASPALSTTQPFSNLRVDANNVTSLVETTIESPASCLANWLTEQQAQRVVYVSNEAVGGTAYDGLDQGSVPSNNTIDNAEDASTHALSNGATGIVFVDCWGHGEQDSILGVDAPTYSGYMIDRQGDLQADLRTRLSAPTLVMPLLMTQLANYSQFGGTVSHPNSPVPIGQWTATESSALVSIATPTYQLTWQTSGDNLHLDNAGACREGEYFAKAIYRSVVTGGPEWQPLHIETANATGNVIVLTYDGGDGSSIVIDSTNMRARHTAGFEYVDTNSDAHITDVQASGRTVTLTLNEDASSTGRVYYGWRVAWEGTLGPTGYGTGGNIRDSDATASRATAVPLHNWAIIQDKPIDSFTAVGVTAPAWANTNSFRSPASAGLLSTPVFTTLNGATSATWSYWIRRDTWSASGLNIWNRNQASGSRQWSFTTGTSGSGTWFIATDVNTFAFYTSANSVFANATWYHVVVVFDGSQGTANNRLRVYVNGTLITGAGTYTGTMPTALTTPAATAGAGMSIFGGNAGGSNVINTNGRDFAIWVGTAFDQADVDELRNGGVPIDPSTHSEGAPDHLWIGETDFADYGSAATPRHLIAWDGVTINGTNP